MPRTRPSSSLRHSPQPSLTWTSSWHRSPTPRRLPDGNRRSVDHPSPSGGSSDRRYTPGATDGPPPIELWHVRTPGRSRTWTGLPDHLSVGGRRRRVEHDRSTCRAPRTRSYRASPCVREILSGDLGPRAPIGDIRAAPRRAGPSARRARRISASDSLGRGTLAPGQDCSPWKAWEAHRTRCSSVEANTDNRPTQRHPGDDRELVQFELTPAAASTRIVPRVSRLSLSACGTRGNTRCNRWAGG
jgi:hypothetical protein